MTFATSLLPLLRSVRGIPGAMGIRVHRVYLLTASWSGARVGDGNETSTEIELTEGGGQPPKVAQLIDERLALGNLAQGSIEIGPVTVPHGAMGLTLAGLLGTDLETQQTLRLRLSGPLGNVLYRVSGTRLHKALHWMLVAEPLAAVAPEEPEPDPEEPEDP